MWAWSYKWLCLPSCHVPLFYSSFLCIHFPDPCCVSVSVVSLFVFMHCVTVFPTASVLVLLPLPPLSPPPSPSLPPSLPPSLFLSPPPPFLPPSSPPPSPSLLPPYFNGHIVASNFCYMYMYMNSV